MIINLFPAIRVISSDKMITHHKLINKKHTDKVTSNLANKVQHLEAKEVKKNPLEISGNVGYTFLRWREV